MADRWDEALCLWGVRDQIRQDESEGAAMAVSVMRNDPNREDRQFGQAAGPHS